MRKALRLGGLQFLNWLVCTVSWRAVSQGNITVSIVSDFILCTLLFFVFSEIADSQKGKRKLLWFFYSVGGVTGTVCGIYLSKIILGS